MAPRSSAERIAVVATLSCAVCPLVRRVRATEASRCLGSLQSEIFNRDLSHGSMEQSFHRWRDFFRQRKTRDARPQLPSLVQRAYSVQRSLAVSGYRQAVASRELKVWLAENAKRAARGDHIRRAQGGLACSSLCRRAGRHGPARSERVAPAGRRHASTHTDCCETRPWTERRTRGHAVTPRRAKADLAASLAWRSATKGRDDAAVAPSVRRSRPAAGAGP